MRKSLLALGVLGVALLFTSKPAQAEPTLRDIIDNTIGDSGATYVNQVAFGGTFLKQAASGPISVAAKYAGNSASLSWYDPATALGNSTPSTNGSIFASVTTGATADISTIAANPFGLYIESGGNRFFSEAQNNLDYNPPSTWQAALGETPDPFVTQGTHFVVYKSNAVANRYYVAVEDLFGGGDRDYNDGVFQFDNVSLVSNPVPEMAYAQLAMLITGGGLTLVRLRRKKA